MSRLILPLTILLYSTVLKASFSRFFVDLSALLACDTLSTYRTVLYVAASLYLSVEFVVETKIFLSAFSRQLSQNNFRFLTQIACENLRKCRKCSRKLTDDDFFLQFITKGKTCQKREIKGSFLCTNILGYEAFADFCENICCI
jgi:hypothetical protein